MRIPWRISFVVLTACIAGCEQDSLDAPRKFFGSHKIGLSPDYGVMKFGNDHVITVMASQMILALAKK
jgi:hypothetical protein